MINTKNSETMCDELPFDDNSTFQTHKRDYTIGSYHSDLKKGILNLQPIYQRKFVWDKKTASKLIESVLMNMPIGSVFLNQNEDMTESVIDGQQRITTLTSFIDGFYPKNSGEPDTTKPFNLIGLSGKYKSYNGKTFKQLPRDLQLKIDKFSIPTTIFDSTCNKNVAFEIFLRLNMGSVKLNIQELRNCMYHGSFNELIKELASDKTFISITHNKIDNRGVREDLVLRFAAFHFNHYSTYRPTIAKFLNDTMSSKRYISQEDEKSLRVAFTTAIKNINYIFGTDAFKRYDNDVRYGGWGKVFNYSLYDIMMNSFSTYSHTKIINKSDIIKDSLIFLMKNDILFSNAITMSTSNTGNTHYRFLTWENKLRNILE